MTSRSRHPEAFTLVEVLLALSIFAMLVGVVAYGVGGSVESEYLDEGSARFETVLRLARAEAAGTGRTLRLVVDDRGACAILWEPNPLEEPGVFLPYPASGWAGSLPNEMVRIVSSVRKDADAYRPQTDTTSLSNDPSEGHPTPEPIGFYPNGSCDSATVELRSTDPDDPRTAVVELDGINAIFQTRILTSSELEDHRKAKENP